MGNLLPGSARHAPGRKFRKNEAAIGRRWPIGMFLMCRSNKVLQLWDATTNEQAAVECQLHGMKESMHSWLKESMNQWINEQMSRWINEPINHQWINESLNQRTNESMNQRLTNEWSEGSVDGYVDGWMGGWMNELLFFVELLPFLSATSSLSSHLSRLLLLWAASRLALL
jgi:hypothetical protein